LSPSPSPSRVGPFVIALLKQLAVAASALGHNLRLWLSRQLFRAACHLVPGRTSARFHPSPRFQPWRAKYYDRSGCKVVTTPPLWYLDLLVRQGGRSEEPVVYCGTSERDSDALLEALIAERDELVKRVMELEAKLNP
jgi:hypothetical protein